MPGAPGAARRWWRSPASPGKLWSRSATRRVGSETAPELSHGVLPRATAGLSRRDAAQCRGVCCAWGPRSRAQVPPSRRAAFDRDARFTGAGARAELRASHCRTARGGGNPLDGEPPRFGNPGGGAMKTPRLIAVGMTVATLTGSAPGWAEGDLDVAVREGRFREDLYIWQGCGCLPPRAHFESPGPDRGQSRRGRQGVGARAHVSRASDQIAPHRVKRPSGVSNSSALAVKARTVMPFQVTSQTRPEGGANRSVRPSPPTAGFGARKGTGDDRGSSSSAGFARASSGGGSEGGRAPLRIQRSMAKSIGTALAGEPEDG